MNLTIKNIPPDVMARLKACARSARRSLNSEILVRLEESVREDPSAINQDHKRQVAALRELCGTWRDDGDHIVPKPIPHPRAGWTEQFERMHREGDDELLI